MKIFNFFDLELKKHNHFKSRKIKLIISGLLLVISFTVIEYRTISLAYVKKNNSSNIVQKKIESRTFPENLRGHIYDRNNKILATTIKTLSLNINPQEILNKHETAIKLLHIFPQLNKK